MQKFTLLIPVIAFLILSGFTNPNDKSAHNRGASDQKEISEGIYKALKLDDFEMLLNFIPGEEELSTLKNSEEERLILNIKDYKKFKSNLRNSFDVIVESGIDKQINWSTVDLVDLEFQEDNMFCRGLLQFEDPRQRQVMVYIDLIKIEDKWYLLNELKELEKE